MTAVICLNWIMGAVFLADSRLSYPGPGGTIVTVRDVCQKLWVPNAWSTLGFAGDLCLGNALAGAFFTVLKDQKWTRAHLLTDDGAMSELAAAALDTHAEELGDLHLACLRQDAGLLFAYIRVVAVNGPVGVFDHNELGVSTVAIDSHARIARSHPALHQFHYVCDECFPILKDELGLRPAA